MYMLLNATANLYRVRQYSTMGSSSSGDWHVVYSDGSCMGNGFKGAHAGLGVYWGDDHP